MTITATHIVGKFVWRELITPDIAGSKKFYGELFGWTFRDVPMGPKLTYTLVDSPTGQEIGGMYDKNCIPNGEQVPSHWGVYISTDDVDAAAKRAVDAGAKLLNGPADIPEIGRFAALMDPQGGVFNVYKDKKGDKPEKQEMPAAGEFCWESLQTSDQQGAARFYAEVVGWERKAFSEQDPNTGVFHRKDGNMAASVVGGLPPGVPTHWMSYVVVEDLAKALAKAEELGAKVLEPRIEVPGIGIMGVIMDPQGAVISPFQGLPQQ